MAERNPIARVGTSGWDKSPWTNGIYRGIPRNKRLESYAERLATVEVNTTFHGFGAPEAFGTWRMRTPADFVFAMKGSGAVTHDSDLRNPLDSLATFFTSGVLSLGEKTGPFLWQFPPDRRFDAEMFEAFLSALPHSVWGAWDLVERAGETLTDTSMLDVGDRPLRHAVEVRHESFEDPRFIELLRRYDAAAAVTNTDGWPRTLEVTSDFVYARLRGDARRYPNGYDEDMIDGWAQRVRGWLDGDGTPDGLGRDVFVYFNDPDNGGANTPSDAMRLQERLDGRPRRRPSEDDQLTLF